MKLVRYKFLISKAGTFQNHGMWKPMHMQHNLLKR